ncbi:MAG: hypothetical protein QOH29_1346 [Actinomycetota bacterium]|nr:hypothetical protein [Actinomycetota bacterium]
MNARRPLSERATTYDATGATASDRSMPEVPGYRHYERTACIGNGSACWDFASDAVVRWGIKTRSGFTIDGDGDGHGHGDEAATVSPVAVDQRRWLVAHVGPFTIREPVRVVAVVDKPDRKGFAYGTLAGHPISGEEAFVVERRRVGSVWLTIRSVSRPSTLMWRALSPVLALAQRVYRRRYFRALVR